MDSDLVNIMKALANPHRMEMLRSIYKEGVSVCCETSSTGVERCSGIGDIAAGIRLAPSTISHHLKELARAGLVSVERHGQSVRILPVTGSLEALKKFAEDMLALARPGLPPLV